MPDVTPNYGWRIPKTDGSDFIIPDDVRLPIGSIDAALKAEENSRLALAARVAALEANTATILTGTNLITASAGFTLNAAYAEKRGKEVQIYYRFIKAAPVIAGGADGNIANVTMGVIVAGWRPSSPWWNGGSTAESGGLNGTYVSQDGTIGLGSTVPNVPISVGDTISGYTTYFIP
jgi:hypothetical protein